MSTRNKEKRRHIMRINSINSFNTNPLAFGSQNKDENNSQPEMMIEIDSYLLRPETVESIYVAWKFTGLQKYRDYAWRIFKSINRSCRCEFGFSSINNVDSNDPNHANSMESFFLAETLKYLYLIFSDSRLISPAHWVFNTEAHPLRIWNESTVKNFESILKFEKYYKKRQQKTEKI